MNQHFKTGHIRQPKFCDDAIDTLRMTDCQSCLSGIGFEDNIIWGGNAKAVCPRLTVLFIRVYEENGCANRGSVHGLYTLITLLGDGLRTPQVVFDCRKPRLLMHSSK